MSFTVVIPARYASIRLPGKALSDIHGKPLIQYVYEQCAQSAADNVVIATDDERIRAAAEAFGADVQMTGAQHQSGTERIAEVAQLRNMSDEVLIVNVQGDEPFLPPELINQVATSLVECKDCDMATLGVPITDRAEVFNPNVVKVVLDYDDRALYFSRAPIPWQRDAFTLADTQAGEVSRDVYYRHVGIYAYRAQFVRRYVALPRSPLEQLEALEQLRALYHGYSIFVSRSERDTGIGVDTPQDLEHARRHVKLLQAR